SQSGQPPLSLTEFHLKASYPAKSPLEDVLRLVTPGTDEFVTEKYAFEIEQELRQWGASLVLSARDLRYVSGLLDNSIAATSLKPVQQAKLRTGQGIETFKIHFAATEAVGR